MTDEDFSVLIKDYKEWRSSRGNPKNPGPIPGGLRKRILKAVEIYGKNHVRDAVGIGQSAVYRWLSKSNDKSEGSSSKEKSKLKKMDFVEIRSTSGPIVSGGSKVSPSGLVDQCVGHKEKDILIFASSKNILQYLNSNFWK